MGGYSQERTRTRGTARLILRGQASAGGIGPHGHHREDEGFWILEGSATFEVGDRAIEAGPGDFVWGPRGVPHRYTVGPEGCRMLYVMTPGGFENLVRGMSVPAAERTLPPPLDEEPDWEALAGVAAENGCEILG